MTNQIKLIGFASLVIVIGASLGTARYLARHRTAPLLPATRPVALTPPPAPTTPWKPEPSTPRTDLSLPKFPPITTTATISPIWKSPAREVSVSDFFPKEFLQSLSDALLENRMPIQTYSDFGVFWVNGKATFSGKNYSTGVFITPCDGMSCTQTATPVLLDEQTHTVILTAPPDASNTYYAVGALAANFVRAPNLTIALPNLPNELEITNGAKLYATRWCSSTPCNDYDFSPEPAVAATSVDGIKLFLASDENYYARMPNGMTKSYTTALAGDSLGLGGGDEFLTSRPAIEIAWKKGYENSNTFSSLGRSSGCGFVAGSNFVSESIIGPASSLVAVGTTANGEILFIPKNYSTHQLTESSYDYWYPVGGDGSKPDMDGFLERLKVPYFFWKDGFGRWIQYKNDAIQSMAECGKPVVYLYPTVTTPVHVQLPSFIRVTKSEPAYPSRGWDVVAQPNGVLTNSDGTVWPNLYWDGVGVNYPDARDGFVVRDGEVASFFAETLPQYGLNAQEAKDFTDFWLPYFSGAKYYRISFLTSEWSDAAPMRVSPRPDTSIRIFMDWQKLSAPISIAAPNIVTPVRDGFTLVEWGGEIPRN